MIEKTMTTSQQPAAGSPGGAARRPPASGRRLSKAALGRAKMAAIAVSVVAFVGSLVGIAQASPNAIARMNANNQPAAAGLVDPAASAPLFSQEPSAPSSSVAPLVLPQAPQMPAIRPFVRSRGS